MNDSPKQAVFHLPVQQQALRARCFHPTGTYREFAMRDVDTSIPSRFEEIADRFPNRLAVQAGATVMTYAELNFRSNQIARAIIARVESRGQPIALLFGHQPAIIASLLACLKSANLYVALDSSYPSHRLRYVITHSTARLILTDKENYPLARTLATEGVEILEIEELGDQICGDNLKLPLSAADDAYIVYTSGSTGQPKGVLHSHCSVLYSGFVESNSMRICGDDRIGLLDSFSSSVSTKYVFSALLNGAALVLCDAKAESLERLRTWLISERITLCHFTASLFRALAGSLEQPDGFPGLRLIVLGAEVVTSQDVSLYRRFFHSGSVLLVSFGTSETATIRSYFVDPTGDDYTGSVPAGYPIEGKSILLLDERGSAVGVGEVGEIAVKSRYLATGYWRDADLTGTKFVPDPNGGEARIYLTGDLGRLDDAGCLYFLGRKDARVKIRGFTVDPGEAEQVLLRHPEIKAAAVVASRSGLGDGQLVAYCVPARNSAPVADDLMRFMQARLPNYLVPEKFVMIDALPLTPSGKLDRRALPDAGNGRPNLSNPYIAPRNAVESTLAAIWSEILSVRPVGITDNFIYLGGHSLAASEVISQVVQRFNLEIPVKALFVAPTVSEMAALITQKQAQRAGEPEVVQMLGELEAMSEEEALRQIAAGGRKSIQPT